MDTKLKNYRYSAGFKLLSVVLCVAGMIAIAYGLLEAPYFEAALQSRDFKESNAGKNIFLNEYQLVADVAFNYKSEENIKSGAALDQESLNNTKSYLQSDRQNQLQQVENNYYEALSQYQGMLKDQQLTVDENGNIVAGTDIITDLKIKDIQEKINQLKIKKDTEIKEINEKYDKLISEVDENEISRQLADYKQHLEMLKNSTGLYYTVVLDGKTIFSNVTGTTSEDNFYSSLPFSVKLSQSNFVAFFKSTYYPYYAIPSGSNVYLGMSQEVYQTKITAFKDHSNKGLKGIVTSSAGLLAFIIGFIYLMYSSGRRTDREGIHLITVDIIFLDIALVVSFASIAVCMMPLVEFFSYYYRDDMRFNAALIYGICSVIIAIGTLIGILFTTMFSKRFKRREVLRHTLIYWVIKLFSTKLRKVSQRIKTGISGVFDKSPLAMRLVLIFGAYAILNLIAAAMLVTGDEAILFGFIVIAGVNGIAVYYLLKNFKTFIDIRNGAERIRAGELTYNIPEQGIPELKSLSITINKIADGLKNAVNSQVKAERMKAELITNVSHDLKTPLTSIITYVDLLKNEGLHCENADKYLGIIDSKSQRLKALTEDLFEAAKAASGSIAVNYEKLNVVSLITQGLGELSDKIEASNLIFKTNLPADNIYVSADGRLTWRIIENLLSNVFKYALPHSRVYIDVISEREKVKIVLKNISAYELNVKEDELLERFKRGDASRHSEGSGLGLSIAKSLAELQGGSFSINIDGDLFKATVEFPQFI